MCKTGAIMEKICTGIMNLKIQKGQQTYTSAQVIIAFTIMIQKKKPSATQKMHRSGTSQKKPEGQ